MYRFTARRWETNTLDLVVYFTKTTFRPSLIPFLTSLAAVVVLPLELHLSGAPFTIYTSVGVGWMGLTILLISDVLVTITAFQIRGAYGLYLKTLPFTPLQLSITRFMAQTLISFPYVSAFLILNDAFFFSFRIHPITFITTIVLLTISAFGMAGFTATLVLFVRSPASFSFLVSFLGTIVTYVSPVYYQLSSLPTLAQLFVLAIPTTPAIQLAQGLIGLGVLSPLEVAE